MTEDTPQQTHPLEPSKRAGFLRSLALSRWLWCPLVVAAATYLLLDGSIEAWIGNLPDDNLVRIGSSVFTTLAVIPFLLPSSLQIHRKFELSAILAGGFVAVVTAILLVQ